MHKPAQIVVITRTKNRPQLLSRCIETILSQSFVDWVHVIVNDGGNRTDVEEVVRHHSDRYNSRILVLHHDETCGMEAAANTGLRKSQSQFIAFLDDDDTWDRQFLTKMVSALDSVEDRDKVQGVVCRTGIVVETLRRGQICEIRRQPFNPDLEWVSLSELIVDNQFTNNAFVFRRAALASVGYLNEQLPVLGDWDFNIRFLLHFDIGLVPETLAYWHWREAPDTVSDRNSIYAPTQGHQEWRVRLMNEAIRGRWLGDGSNLSLILALGSRLQTLERQVQVLTGRVDRGVESILEDTRRTTEGTATRGVEALSNQLFQQTQTINEQFALLKESSFLRQLRRAVVSLVKHALNYRK